MENANREMRAGGYLFMYSETSVFTNTEISRAQSSWKTNVCSEDAGEKTAPRQRWESGACSAFVSGIKTITWHNANSRAQIRLAVDFLKEY